MSDTTHRSNEILRDAKSSLVTQRQGGYHRRAGSIGRGSAEIRRRNLMTRIKLIAGSAVAIVMAAIVAGLIIDGIGFVGVMVTAMAIMCAIAVFSNFPKVKVPKRSSLNTGDVRQMVARTELWLEHQRPALPPPAVTLVDRIGVQLDALGLQLETVDPAHPSTREVRKLVGEHLPEMVESYRKIPAHLRQEKRGTSSPDEQLAESLGKISEEIDSVTRQLAEGSLDDLAIRTRFLDYRYGAGPEAGSGVPLPDFASENSKAER